MLCVKYSVATSLIRNMLAIIQSNLLKQDLTFPLNRSSCSSGSSSGSTNTCGSSCKIFPWIGKYKLGAIAGARFDKYNLGTRTGKVSVRVGKHKLGSGLVNANFVQLGPSPGAK